MVPVASSSSGPTAAAASGSNDAAGTSGATVDANADVLPPTKRVKVARETSAVVGAVVAATFPGLAAPAPLGVVEIVLLHIGLAGQAALASTSRYTQSVVKAVRSTPGYPQRLLRGLFAELDHHKFPSNAEGDDRAMKLVKQRVAMQRVAMIDDAELIPVSIPPLSGFGALLDFRGTGPDHSGVQVSSYLPPASIQFDKESPGSILLDVGPILEDEWNRSVILPLAKEDRLWITLHFHQAGSDRYLLVFSAQFSGSFIRCFSEQTSTDVWQSLYSYALSKNSANAAIGQERLRRNGLPPAPSVNNGDDGRPWAALDFVRTRCRVCTCREGLEKLRQIGSAHESHYNDHEHNNFVPMELDERIRPEQFLYPAKICRCCRCGYECHRLRLRLSFRGVDTKVGALWMLRNCAMSYETDGSSCCRL